MANDLASFRLFYNSIVNLDIITIDDIINAISKIDPLPASVLPLCFKRTTKRHVFPTAIMNTVHFLNGTFKWNWHSTSTSIDVIFNKPPMNAGNIAILLTCHCKKENVFFAIDHTTSCSFCGGISPFLSTTTRIRLAQTLFANANSYEHCKSRGDNISRSSKLTLKNSKHRLPSEQSNATPILRDITNLSARSRLCLSARPADTLG